MPKRNSTIRTYHFYILIDPRTNEPCYVGITTDPQSRLYGHKQMQKTNVRKCKAIRELLDAGYTPTLEVIDTITTDDYHLALRIEYCWIVEYGRRGAKLLNAFYGEYLSNPPHEPLSRVAILKQAATMPKHQRIDYLLGFARQNLIDWWWIPEYVKDEYFARLQQS